MTKQEAIKILDWIPTKGDEVDAMEMAIEALQRGLENVNADSCSEEPNRSDLISRQDAIDAVDVKCLHRGIVMGIQGIIEDLPSAQPEIIRCKDCVYYDPPHVENNGVRSEYSEMPEDAFDVLGVGLVSAEYGINIGGRCCRDYNVSYSEDKRVFVPETNYCGRAERKTDE